MSALNVTSTLPSRSAFNRWLLLFLCAVVSPAGHAQTDSAINREAASYDASTNLLSIPSIDVDGNHFQAALRIVSNSPDVELELLTVEAVEREGPPSATFSAGILAVPDLVVDGVSYEAVQTARAVSLVAPMPQADSRQPHPRCSHLPRKPLATVFRPAAPIKMRTPDRLRV